ncbi:MAG: hypothetical protein K2L25_02110 [Alphaproteobacteria bacterium]|nr:hypothetical protein [Alphaproteobacteria bacterium]
MARQIQMRRGTSAQHNNFTGAPGEVTVDTDLNTLRVHDGVTPGGTILASRDEIATQIMPGSNYIELALGASGARYTAPASGYFTINKAAGTSGAYLTLLNLSSGIGITTDGYQTGAKYLWVPAAAGDTVTVSYSFSGATAYFRFVKAKSYMA